MKRKQKSIFNGICTYINNVGVGSTFKLKDLREQMSKTHVSHATVMGGMPYKVSADITQLMTTKCIVRESRGVYKVMGLIPDFVTLSTCDANRGYKNCKENPDYKPNMPRTNENSPYIYTPRGIKWQLGDTPLPMGVTKALNNLLKTDGYKVGEHAEPKMSETIIKGCVVGMLSQRNSRQTIKAKVSGVVIFIIGLDANPSYCRVRYQNGITGVIPFKDIKEVVYVPIAEMHETMKPKPEHSIDVATTNQLLQFGGCITKIDMNDKGELVVKFWPGLGKKDIIIKPVGFGS